MSITVEPFGSYSLAPWRENLRKLASLQPDNKLGKWAISLLRKASLIGHKSGMNGPFDIKVAENVAARLFPGTNRCEKRAYAGVQVWDQEERKALDNAINSSAADQEFVFLDIGANVGLYSLFVNASAKVHGRKVRIIAVEPDDENRGRLTFNFNASNCDAEVEPIGISDATGTGVLSLAQENRGGISVLDSGEGQSIKLETLAGLIKRHGLTHINAMKIDIEGRDLAALNAMLSDAPKSVWPDLLIAETGREEPSPIIEKMLGNGYYLYARPGINAILKLDRNGRTVEEAKNG